MLRSKKDCSITVPWILSDDVHDVGGDDGLVVFALLLLAEPQQVFDDGDEEPLLVFLMHRAGYRSDGPTESVQVLPRPLVAVHLKGEEKKNNILRISTAFIFFVN